ncbi:hypothetical protein [Bradyrhizobium sp. dw_411]|uniref:hypothetical protein n=1 Tax=Bradyrhizobium sp. dw_411 TaxID=2720082 RepID=UPI001BD0B5E7|nr:hypothetical protein [Bradyrhizobium sp. dw_411]
MAIDHKLLTALENKLGLSRSQINRRISDEVAAKHLPRKLAAISLASQYRLALGAHSDKTILVQVGDIRDISDIAGKHMVHLSNSFASRKHLADRLESKLKFKVDLTGTTWQDVGNFNR